MLSSRVTSEHVQQASEQQKGVDACMLECMATPQPSQAGMGTCVQKHDCICLRIALFKLYWGSTHIESHISFDTLTDICLDSYLQNPVSGTMATVQH